VPDNNLICTAAQGTCRTKTFGPPGQPTSARQISRTRKLYGDFMGVTVDGAKAIELGEGDRTGGPTDRRPPLSSI
jgi:hypothetical protein